MNQMARASREEIRSHGELGFNVRIEGLVLSQLMRASKCMQTSIPVVPQVPGSEEEKLVNNSSGPAQRGAHTTNGGVV